ncbi:MAG TPA: hypothetical protein VD906_09570 [Caulobacteraceae bacterium]|nr:hypothetical protein [Caulobacteraceae bacterium]
MSDLSTPRAVVERAYELISFGPGSEPGWPMFRALFTGPAVLALRLFPGDSTISVMDLDAYEAAQVTASMKAEGYEERIVEAAYRETGDVCEARVAFQMVFGPDRVHDALDLFQLVRLEGQWRIASIVSEVLGSPS